MKIKIKHRITKKVIYEANCSNLKEALVKAVKEGAYLRDAYLEGADLKGADLRGAYLEGADLRGAYLEGAYLEGADLEGADLRGAYLEGADLRGAKQYSNSHDFIAEIIYRNSKEITKTEWQLIGEIYITRYCWDIIKKKFGRKILPLLKKVKGWGFAEYYDEYVKLLKS